MKNKLLDSATKPTAVLLTPSILVHKEVFDILSQAQVKNFIMDNVTNGDVLIMEVEVTPIGCDSDGNFNEIGFLCKDQNRQRLDSMIFTIDKNPFGRIHLIRRFDKAP